MWLPTMLVLDTCAGTGGFPISAMKEMDVKAGNDQERRMDIRKHRLVGVEQQQPTCTGLYLVGAQPCLAPE